MRHHPLRESVRRSRRAAVAFLLIAPAAAAGTFPEPPPGSTLTTATLTSPAAVFVPDLDSGNSPVEVSGMPGTVWDVNVVVNVDHPDLADLEFVLVAPSNRLVGLAVRKPFAPLATTFDDSAELTVLTATLDDHLLAPESSFARLLGEEPNGVWSLVVNDSVAGNTAYFTWSLEIATIDAEPSAQTTSVVREAGVSIPANGTVVTGVEFPVPGIVRAVRLVVHVIHDDPSDLELRLRKDGRTCLLGAGRGVVPDYLSNATFDDQATPLYPLTNPNVPLGSVCPVATLDLFRDLQAAGVWELEVVNGDTQTGSLLGWELVVEVYDDPLPSAICEGAAPAPCPCDNHGAAGSGCRNATQPDGASLAIEVDGGGPPTVGGDVVLVARDLDPFQIVLFVQGTQAADGGTGVPFGDGLLCASGQVRRLATRYSGLGTASYPGPFDLPLSRRGGIPPEGGTRTYQAIYRSPLLFGPCHTGLNTTNGVLATWLPEAP